MQDEEPLCRHKVKPFVMEREENEAKAAAAQAIDNLLSPDPQKQYHGVTIAVLASEFTRELLLQDLRVVPQLVQLMKERADACGRCATNALASLARIAPSVVNALDTRTVQAIAERNFNTLIAACFHQNRKAYALLAAKRGRSVVTARLNQVSEDLNDESNVLVITAMIDLLSLLAEGSPTVNIDGVAIEPKTLLRESTLEDNKNVAKSAQDILVAYGRQHGVKRWAFQSHDAMEAHMSIAQKRKISPSSRHRFRTISCVASESGPWQRKATLGSCGVWRHSSVGQ